MVSVLVEKFSKNKRTMALVNKPNYSLLQSSLKIDDLIDPRMSTVSSILKHVHKGTIENAYTILNGEYEVIEADILESSELVNKELKNADLPDEIRVGAILRDNKFILPSSKYIFQKDDTVVLLAKRDQLPLVENLFRIRRRPDRRTCPTSRRSSRGRTGRCTSTTTMKRSVVPPSMRSRSKRASRSPTTKTSTTTTSSSRRFALSWSRDRTSSAISSS